MVKHLPKYRTPGTPGMVICKPIEPGAVINKEDHKLYRQGVGMLLYLQKYSRPDISNAVRELAKGMQTPTPNAFKELKRVLKFVIDKKNLGLRMEPTIDKSQNWDMETFTDSDWAGDKDTRRSVSGFILFLLKCPICWKSRQQDVISLSSSEAEIYACSDAVKEIMFMSHVLNSMRISFKTPIVIRVDNVGAIFMAENITASKRTKHVDVGTKYITYHVENGFIKIKFVKSEENLSDGFTKNVTGDTYERHLKSFVDDRDFVDRET